MQINTTLSKLNKKNPKAVSEIQKVLLATGDKAQGMKIYMREAKVGLKESKDAIDKELDFLQKDNPKLQELVKKADSNRLKFLSREFINIIGRK